jgi:glycosyltransferase involved in cell wall biosynthesis
VLVDQTIEYQVYKRYADNFRFQFLKPFLYIDVAKTKYWEEYFWKKASRAIAVSEKDAHVMKYLVPGLKVTVIPNGVGEDLIKDVPLHYSKKILLVGNFAWLQNIEAAKILVNEVFPRIYEKIPDASVDIIGQHTEKVGELKGENVSLIDLEVDDIEGIKKAYQSSGILIAPLYGPGGTRLKILGAMAAKLPVVTTSVGIADIGENGKSFLLGETPKELADQAIKLLNDKKLYEKIAQNARALVEENYSYESIAEKLSEVYQEVKTVKSNL